MNDERKKTEFNECMKWKFGLHLEDDVDDGLDEINQHTREDFALCSFVDSRFTVTGLKSFEFISFKEKLGEVDRNLLIEIDLKSSIAMCLDVIEN